MNPSPKQNECAVPELCGEMRYVARQPILDLYSRVHGYELFFRSGPEGFFHGDRDAASRTMIDNAVLFGLNQLTCGLPAFIKCSADALTERLVDVLPPSMVVLDLLETTEPTPQMIQTCQMLKSNGFRIALGSYSWQMGFEPLLDLTDYVKVDFTQMTASARHYLQNRGHQVSAALVAQKVETQQDYLAARQEGFTLFQGYHFCRPELMRNRKVPANRLAYLRILELLHRDPVDLHELSKWVKQDTSLTYRLLRLVNSPVAAIRQEVRSIEAALMVVGEEMFCRIATLAIASELNVDRPTEILRMAFVRGRFCEIAAQQCALNATEQYLLGMLSMLPSMLCIPMESLTPTLPLRDPIRQALHGVANRERKLLDWIECHEMGDWPASDAIVHTHSLRRDELMSSYADAVVWAEDALHSIA